MTGRPTKQSPSRKGEPALEEKPPRKARRNSSGQFAKQTNAKRPHDSKKKNDPKENGVAKKVKPNEPKLSQGSPLSPVSKRPVKSMKGLTGNFDLAFFATPLSQLKMSYKIYLFASV